MNNDLEDFKQASPYIRTFMAMILYLRFYSSGSGSFEWCYASADRFLNTLQNDLKSNS